MKQDNESADFYFSAKQSKMRREIGEHLNFVNGIEYTEMITQGRKPVSKFDDLVLVYSGSNYTIFF